MTGQSGLSLLRRHGSEAVDADEMAQAMHRVNRIRIVIQHQPGHGPTFDAHTEGQLVVGDHDDGSAVEQGPLLGEDSAHERKGDQEHSHRQRCAYDTQGFDDATTRVLLAGPGRAGRPCRRSKRRVAHLSRAPERQPPQRADSDQHGNVAHLAPKWIFPMPVSSALCRSRRWSSTASCTSPRRTRRLRSTRARAGKIWHYSRPRTQGLVGDAASGINRGVAVLGDRVFMVTDNAHLIRARIASRASCCGTSRWRTHRQHYGATSAPLVVNDLVIAGISGGDEGIRGFLDAYKASTGERVWRFWTMPARGEPGSETWIGKALEHGCAATWLTGTYDPRAQLALLADRQSLSRLQRRRAQGRQPVHELGAGARSRDREAELALPVHAARSARLGRDGNSGARRCDVPRPAAQAAAAGQSQRLLLRARPVTGEFLLAEPFVKKLTWASGIGPDGRPELAPDQSRRLKAQLRLPLRLRRNELAVHGVQPGYRLVLPDGAGIVQHLHARTTSGGARANRSTAAARAARPGRDQRQVSSRARYSDGKVAWEVPVEGGFCRAA